MPCSKELILWSNVSKESAQLSDYKDVSLLVNMPKDAASIANILSLIYAACSGLAPIQR